MDAEAFTGPAVELDEVEKTFGGGRRLAGGRRPAVHAVRGVSFRVKKGETIGIVGESGCGKTTLARMIVGLDRPTTGRVAVAGAPPRPGAAQFVFQDSGAALNPRRPVRHALAVPLARLAGLHRSERERRMAELMDLVSLDEAFLDRFPHELSGGQAQRIGIARALAAEADVLVLDEPVSALDVSMQAQVLDLLAALRMRLGLTYLFISHDLAVVEAVSDTVAVLYFGKVAEIGPARDVFARPRHPYTALLLASAPVPGRPPRVSETGETELPDPYAPPPGCAFASRCPRALEVCHSVQPPLEAKGAEARHRAACHNPVPQ